MPTVEFPVSAWFPARAPFACRIKAAIFK